jgi:UDP-GlcNAc:undecaprenyl-phosphate GlcNAc-1-phosphate transferase
MNSLLCGLVTLLGTALAVWALTPAGAALGLRFGLVDLPSTRRTRARPVPTTGGVVAFLGLAASTLVALALYRADAPGLAQKVTALLLGGAVIVTLGAVDDRVNLKPATKLAVQMAVAALMSVSGVAFETARFALGSVFHIGWLAHPLTVLWFLAFMNAMNLIDGLDGLAGGIAAMAAAALVAVGLLNGNPLLYVPAAGLLGSSLGFLVHNFGMGNVYLGDAGSMVLGFFIAGSAVIGSGNDAAGRSVLAAAACMAVPAFDVATTIARRLRTRRGLLTPDREHTHHRLIRFGLSPRATVLVLWGVTVFLGLQALALFTPLGFLLLVASYGVVGLVGWTLATQRRKNAVTTDRDLRGEFLYLAGVRSSIGSAERPASRPAGASSLRRSRARGEGDVAEVPLRDVIVEQIRREALYRRLTRARRPEPSRTAGPPATPTARAKRRAM